MCFNKADLFPELLIPLESESQTHSPPPNCSISLTSLDSLLLNCDNLSLFEAENEMSTFLTPASSFEDLYSSPIGIVFKIFRLSSAREAHLHAALLDYKLNFFLPCICLVFCSFS